MSNTIIRWQYPNEEPVQIIGGDSYSFQEIEQPCPGLRHEFRYSRVDIVFDSEGYCSFGGFNTTFARREWIGFKEPPFTNFRLYANGQLIKTSPDVAGLFDSDGSPIFSHWSYRGATDPRRCGDAPYDNNKLYRLFCDTADRTDLDLLTTQATGFQLEYFGIEDPYRPGVPLPDCPPDQCKFTVYTGNREVYQRTEDVCPRVEEFDFDACPPDTCPVPCGNSICCYQRNGISIKRIPR